MSEPEGATRQLAVFAAGVRYETLPARVKELLPVLLIDLFRASAVGRRQTWTAKATQVLLAASGAPTAAIMYSAVRADPVRAAYLNGVITGSLDWDDSHIAAIIDPGIIIWPAIFAAAEVTGANGIAIAEAAAAGYETAIRIGMSVQLDHALRGFQGTPTCGVFGAAVAAGRLLGLDETGLQNALGIAASYSRGLSQFFVSGSDVKRLHAGKTAAAGVEIALLVKAGLTGPADAIEGAQGFGRAVSDSFAPDIITKDLDRHYWLEAIALKVHAGTVRLQAAIEAAELLARGGIKPGDIERIEIGVPKILMGKLTWNAPVDQQQAQMGAPFAVAMIFFLVEARPGPLIVGIDDFGEMVHRNEVRELAARTNCVVDDEIDQRMAKGPEGNKRSDCAGEPKMPSGFNNRSRFDYSLPSPKEYVPARVTVFLKDGEAKTAKVMLPKGCQQNPITETEVCERFHMMVRDYMPAERAEAWLVKAKNFQRLNDVKELMI